MSYDFEVKKPDNSHERVEFTPVLALGAAEKIIDNRRDTMVWGPENKSRRDAAIIAAGGEPPKTPFWWGQKQETTVGLWPGAQNSPALRPADDTNMGPYLVIKVNGEKLNASAEIGGWMTR